MKRHRVRLGGNGSLIIPREYLRALGAEEGDELLVRLVDGEVRVSAPKAAIRRAQATVRRYVPKEHSLVAELLAERKQEGRA